MSQTLSVEDFLALNPNRAIELRAIRNPWASAWALNVLEVMGRDWLRNHGGPLDYVVSVGSLMNAIWGEGTFARAMASIDEPKPEPVIVAPSAIPFMPALTVLPDDVLAAVA